MRFSEIHLPHGAALVLLLVAISATTTNGQPGNNQNRLRIRQAAGLIQAEWADQNAFLVLPAPPRQLRRALSEARDALDEKRYADAVEALSEILDGGDSEDFFLPTEGDEKTQTSLRTAARDLLGSMPTAARELYELQIGTVADRLLKDAIAASDVNAVREVSRRYFHTQAGYEATMLMGRYDLDQNRPVSAALNFQRVLNAPQAAPRFQPELSVLLAASWQLAGYEDKAREVFQRTQPQLAGATVTMVGKPVKLAGDADEMMDWLKSLLQRAAVTGESEAIQWTMAGGNPSRSARVAGGMPLTKVEWALESAVWPTDELVVHRLQRQFRDQDIAALPSLQPLAVGKYVLVRTARMMFAVDLQSGKRIWPYPWDGTEESDTSQDEDTKAAVERPILLKQRMWDDNPYGQMSSDGSHLYLLRDLDAMPNENLTPEIVMLGGRRNPRRGRGKAPRNFNRLVALELATEGKTKWSVGGQDSQEPSLTNAFFLGPPLPLADRLYVIAEMKDEVKLLVLDSASGQLEWSQQLAQLETPYSITFDATRRLGGASPSFADGILLCPTSSGAVVSVDVSTQSLSWAYQYARDNMANDTQQRHFFNMPYPLPGMPPTGKRWADPTLRIVDGRVLLTPVESNYLHCLDLYTGQAKWRPVKRGNALFVACVHEDTILLVETNRLRSLRLSDGKTSWRAVNLPGGAMPSGRGFHAGDHYYLPTTDAQLHRIEIATGEIVESLKTDQVLGNLICYQDYLISQGADAIYAFSLRDRKRSIVDRRMRENPLDPDTLEDYANLLFGDGEWDEALETMRRAVALHASEDRVAAAQATLRRMIAETLRSDFPRYQPLAAEALELSISPAERREVALLEARGLKEAGDVEPAFQAYLRLLAAATPAGAAAADDDEHYLLHAAGGWRAREDVWLAHEINDLVNIADEDEKVEIERAIFDYFRNAIDLGEREQLRVCLRYFRNHPQAAEVRMQLAALETADGHALAAEFLMLSAETSGDPRMAAAAMAARADLYLAHGQTEAAWAVSQRLSAEWPDEVLPDGSTGGQRYADLSGQPPSDVHRWQRGTVEVKSIPYDRKRQYKQWLSIPVSGHSDGWPEGTSLAVARQQKRLLLVDRLGNTTTLGQLGGINWNYFTTAHARVHGHLLVVSFGTHLVAFDLFRAGNQDAVLWKSESWPPLEDNNLFPMRFRAVRRNVPFAPVQPGRIEAGGQMLAQVASVSQHGVCYARQGDLFCLDPLSGERKWIQRGMDKESSVLGDEHLVFVTNNDNGGTRVFDMWDGHELDLRPSHVPKPDRHWLTLGRRILTWSGSYPSGRGLRVHLFDPLTSQDIWSRPVPARSVGCVVGQDALALLDRAGELTILRVEDGEVMLQAQLELDAGLELESLQVLRSSDQYVVIVNHDDEARIRELRSKYGIQVHIPASGQNYRPRITGKVYAFDRETGQPMWQEPATVAQYGVSLGLAPDVPILVFVRHVTRRQKDPKNGKLTNVARSSLVCLDRRDGSIVYENHELPMRALSYFVEAKPAENTLEVLVPQTHHVVLTFTDEPRPPAAVGRLPAVTPAFGKSPRYDLPKALEKLFK